MGAERRPRRPGHVWHQMVLPIEGFSCGARIKLPTMDPFSWFGFPAIFLCWRTCTLEELAPRGPSTNTRLLKAFPVKQICCCLNFAEALRPRALGALEVR